MCADSADGMFVTLFFALLDPSTGTLTYVNAGHNPPLLCRAGDDGGAYVLDELRPSGMALGVVDDFEFEERTVQLEPGDVLLLYTDGVPDASGAGQQQFGMDRLKRVLLDARSEPVAGIVAALERSIEGFTGGEAQFDDIAVLAVKRLGVQP
jgi:sigma-B regulation protein RsbU (phosphoserine phosphatase)